MAASGDALAAIEYVEGTGCRVVVAPFADGGRRWTTAGSLSPCPSAHDVVCAGGAATPCLLERRVDGELRFLRFDPFRGTTGAVAYRVKSGGAGSSFSALSPSGRYLAIPDHGVSIVDLTTGTARAIALDRAPSYLAWAPGDRALIATGFENDAGIAEIDVATGRWRTLVEPGPDWIARPAISSDGRRLAVLRMPLAPATWLLEGYRPAK